MMAGLFDAACTSSDRHRGQAMDVGGVSVTRFGPSSSILFVAPWLGSGMLSIVTKPGSNSDSNVRDVCARLHTMARLFATWWCLTVSRSCPGTCVFRAGEANAATSPELGGPSH